MLEMFESFESVELKPCKGSLTTGIISTNLISTCLSSTTPPLPKFEGDWQEIDLKEIAQATQDKDFLPSIELMFMELFLEDEVETSDEDSNSSDEDDFINVDGDVVDAQNDELLDRIYNKWDTI